MNAQIAVVIVNWNKRTGLLRLLGDLRQVATPPFDLFVVDNASTDGSAEAVRRDHPEAVLIANAQNLGGTGGFNSGIARVLESGGYAYVWLLDNDVRITPTTLAELVRVMDSHATAGMVGSRIMDIDAPEVTVEAGANLRWDMMGVVPAHRNTKAPVSVAAAVDYVAICSALVRTAAVRRVGLMDPRFFLLWDDMEWGLRFNAHGYEVLAAPASVVYHGSFTERARGAPTDYYYAIRNPLLVYTRHADPLRRACIFYRSLRYHLRIYLFFRDHGHREAAELMRRALCDYLLDRWGRLAQGPPQNAPSTGRHLSSETLGACRSIIVSTVGASRTASEKMLRTLNEQASGAEITLLIHADRRAYFDRWPVLTLDKARMRRLSYLFRRFQRIRRGRFHAMAGCIPSPFMYATPLWLAFDDAGRMVSSRRTGLSALLRLVMAMGAAEIMAAALLPALWLKSVVVRKSDHRRETRPGVPGHRH